MTDKFDGLLNEISVELQTIRSFVEQNPVFNGYNYGKYFYQNDKSFRNFAFCNQKLVALQGKIQELESERFSSIYSSSLEDLDDENLLTLNRILKEKNELQNAFIEQIEEKVSSIPNIRQIIGLLSHNPLRFFIIQIMNEQQNLKLLISNLQNQNKALQMQNQKLKKQIESNQDYDHLYSNIMTVLKTEEGEPSEKTDEVQKLKKKLKKLNKQFEEKEQQAEDMAAQVEKLKRLLDEKEQEVTTLQKEQEYFVKALEGIHLKIQNNNSLYSEIKKVLQDNLDIKNQVEKLNLQKESASNVESLRQSFYNDNNIYGNSRTKGSQYVKDKSLMPKNIN